MSIRRMSAHELDRKAGDLFKAGEFTEARKVLGEALRQYPGEKELWFDRLAIISAREHPRVSPEDRARNALDQAGMLPPDKQELSRPEPSPLPPVGVHRENGGPTTLSTFGRFERTPDPGPRHHCPGCTTATEKDGNVSYQGPQIQEHQELCQGCEVLVSIGPMPPEFTRSEAEAVQPGPAPMEPGQ